MTHPNQAAIREAQSTDRALRYFDGGRAEFQRHHPNKARRFPWWAVGLIAFGVAGFIVMFGR